MKICIIGNPIAGGGRAEPAMQELGSILVQRGHAVELHLTGSAEDAKHFAATLPDDTNRLVIAGGDGTVNQVVNGLREPGAVPILQLPFGTANMLACELGLPSDPAAAAERVENGSTRNMDLGVIRPAECGADDAGRSHRFLLVASAGFDAMVTQSVAERRTGTMGFRAYARPIWQALCSYSPPELRVTVDGAPPLEGAMVVLGNTRNYGRIFSITDRARIDSGCLDVCVLKKGSISALAGYTLEAFFRKRMSSRRDVSYAQGRSVCITSAGADEVPVEVDGDWWGRTPVEVEVLPGALRVVGAAVRE